MSINPLPSDSASVATEYSLKFDESMTEDEIEEKSFRSLLPSESHRRINLEKKRGTRDDSDEEVSPEKTALSSIKVCQVTIVKVDKLLLFNYADEFVGLFCAACAYKLWFFEHLKT